MRCPACPQPGLNLPDGWQNDTEKYISIQNALSWLTIRANRFKYTRGVMFDGYFGAQHRPMKNPEDDVRFADGHAFTVGDARYKMHLGTASEIAEVCRTNEPLQRTKYLTTALQENPTCNEHRAVFTAAVSHGKYEATGIGAAACSRHGFFQPHSCVDFQLGERSV